MYEEDPTKYIGFEDGNSSLQKLFEKRSGWGDVNAQNVD